MGSKLRKILIVFSTCLGLVSSYLFFVQYVQKNFDGEGRAFDPVEGVVSSTNSFVWGPVALIFFIPLLLLAWAKLTGAKR